MDSRQAFQEFITNPDNLAFVTERDKKIANTSFKAGRASMRDEAMSGISDLHLDQAYHAYKIVRKIKP